LGEWRRLLVVLALRLVGAWSGGLVNSALMSVLLPCALPLRWLLLVLSVSALLLLLARLLLLLRSSLVLLLLFLLVFSDEEASSLPPCPALLLLLALPSLALEALLVAGTDESGSAVMILRPRPGDEMVGGRGGSVGDELPCVDVSSAEVTETSQAAAAAAVAAARAASASGSPSAKKPLRSLLGESGDMRLISCILSTLKVLAPVGESMLWSRTTSLTAAAAAAAAAAVGTTTAAVSAPTKDVNSLSSVS
jgi:hypothetical protein